MLEDFESRRRTDPTWDTSRLEKSLDNRMGENAERASGCGTRYNQQIGDDRGMAGVLELRRTEPSASVYLKLL